MQQFRVDLGLICYLLFFSLLVRLRFNYFSKTRARFPEFNYRQKKLCKNNNALPEEHTSNLQVNVYVRAK